MSHLILLIICILSVEIIYRLNLLSKLTLILEVFKKVIFIIPNNKISDFQKEKVIPIYALKIMKLSIQILLPLLLIISSILAANCFFDSFLELILSFSGIVESIVITFGYFYFRKLILV
tara:strand:+ start:171 stop:527 length:357 start_codon:yes stop_codon:yes gene_type:complete